MAATSVLLAIALLAVAALPAVLLAAIGLLTVARLLSELLAAVQLLAVRSLLVSAVALLLLIARATVLVTTTVVAVALSVARLTAVAAVLVTIRLLTVLLRRSAVGCTSRNTVGLRRRGGRGRGRLRFFGLVLLLVVSEERLELAKLLLQVCDVDLGLGGRLLCCLSVRGLRTQLTLTAEHAAQRSSEGAAERARERVATGRWGFLIRV